MAGPDKPDKTRGATAGGGRSTRRRKATRAPILDLEATEIKKEATTPEPPAAAEAAGAEETPPTEPQPEIQQEPQPDAADEPAAQADAGPVEPPAAPREAGMGSTATIAASAVAGAILAGLLVITIGRMGLLAPDMPVQPAIDLTALDARITAVETAVASPPATRDAGLVERVGQIEQAAERASGLSNQLAAVTARVDRLDASLAETGTKAQSALTGLQGIEAAVREIGSRPADGSAGPSTEGLELKIANLAQRLDRLAEEATSAGGGGARLEALDRDMAALRDTIAETKADLDGLSSTIAGMPPAAERKTVDDLRQDLGTRLDAIEARLGGPGETRGAAAALALAGLGRAVLDGQPYAAELAAFAALVPDDPAVEVLEPHASAGLRTRAALVAGFPEVLKRLEALQAGDRADGLGARIMARLRSVVTVRRTGEAAGTSPQAVVARMARALEAGNLEGAVGEGEAAGEALPEAAARWLADARARIAAEKALEEADGRMIAVLGRTGG
jgi:hypothetical protein